MLLRRQRFDPGPERERRLGKVFDAENFHRLEHHAFILSFRSHFVADSAHDGHDPIWVLSRWYDDVDNGSGPAHGCVGKRIDRAVGKDVDYAGLIAQDDGSKRYCFHLSGSAVDDRRIAVTNLVL